MNGVPQFEIPIPHFDKVVHFGLFGVHAVLVSAFIGSRHWAWKVFAIGLVLGTMTEFLQSFVPGRKADGLDLLADMLGTVSGLLAIYFVKKNE